MTDLRQSHPVTFARRVLHGALVAVAAGSFSVAPLVAAPLAAASSVSASVPPADSEAEAFDDNSSTRRIQLITAALAAAGLGLAGVTVWFWRSTRPDPDALGPLEVMSGSRWRRQDSDRRVRSLASVRQSPQPVAAPPPAVDLAALAASRDLPSLDDHAGFGDLVGVGLLAEGDAVVEHNGHQEQVRDDAEHGDGVTGESQSRRVAAGASFVAASSPLPPPFPPPKLPER
jgi:hypothetical protein